MSDREEIKEGYTRVTEILKPWSDFSKIMEKVLENKRQIGCRLHNAIHMYNECLPMDIDDSIRGYFESFLRWMKQTQATIMFSEKRFYDNDWMITGCIDSVVRFPNEREAVSVDWKTVASLTKEGKISWGYQGAFYHYLMEKNGVPELGDRYLFLQLDKNGGLPLVREYEYSNKIMGECETLLKAYRLYNPL